MIELIQQTIRKEGVFGMFLRIPGFLYRTGFRKLLPTTGFVLYNGVKVDTIKLGDSKLPPKLKTYTETSVPNYETALAKGLRSEAKAGDRVLIVGGGFGVTTCIASHLVGALGTVTCYEASKDAIRKIKKTIKYNDCRDNIELHNRCVGKPVSIWGDMTSKFIESGDLPECDILELDCEGSELGILQNLRIRPRTIFVETHGIFGAPTDQVAAILKDLQYRIADIEVAEIDLRQQCEEKDIKVITAHRA
jgi:hypothetical protein